MRQFARLLLDAPRESPGLLWRVWASYARFGLPRFFMIASNQLQHRTLPLLRHVKVPTLVVEGTRDPVVSGRAVAILRDHLPAGQVKYVPGAHVFFFSNPQPVACLIHSFARSTSRHSCEQ